jgi:hypothetical protein
MISNSEELRKEGIPRQPRSMSNNVKRFPYEYLILNAIYHFENTVKPNGASFKISLGLGAGD